MAPSRAAAPAWRATPRAPGTTSDVLVPPPGGRYRLVPGALAVPALARRPRGSRGLAPCVALCLLVLHAIVASGCGGDGGTGPGRDAFTRADFPALFAPPTAVEKQLVLADWAARDLAPRGVRVEVVDTAAVGIDSVAIRIVSHLVSGERHYGALVVPLHRDGPRPVLVYTHFSDLGVSVEATLLALGAVAGLRASQFVLAIPSFRGAYLTYDTRLWRSEGLVSPWDGEVDDALALLRVARDTVPSAAPDRAATLGLSAGGTVALLAAVRDPGVERVVDFFAPADFFGPFVQGLLRDILDGRPPDLPRIPQLQAQVVDPWVRGQIPLAQMRLELLRRSAAHFAERLPPVLAHHGTADDTVPADETRTLVAAVEASGGRIEAHYYADGTHSPFGLGGSLGRTAAFLGVLSPAGRPAGPAPTARWPVP